MRTGAVVPSSNALERLITSDIVPNCRDRTGKNLLADHSVGRSRDVAG